MSRNKAAAKTERSLQLTASRVAHLPHTLSRGETRLQGHRFAIPASKSSPKATESHLTAQAYTGVSLAAYSSRHGLAERQGNFGIRRGLTAAIPAAASNVVTTPAVEPDVTGVGEASPLRPITCEARRRADFAAMQAFRPGYAFWQHVFTIPDGSIAFGSAVDGRLLATFPAKGVWTRQAVWGDPAIARILDGQRLAPKLSERREQVALLLEGAAGPVLHNSTRGDALLTNAARYGPFLAEWGAIYERFGVPAEIGLAQVIFESGLNGRGARKPTPWGSASGYRRTGND